MNFKTVRDFLIVNASDTISVLPEGSTTSIASGKLPTDYGQIRVFNNTLNKGTLPIFGGQVLNWRYSTYAAAQSQIVDIGWNGTSGAIETPVDDQTYTVRFDFQDLWEFCYPKTELQVKSSTSGETPSTLADKLVTAISGAGYPMTASKTNSGSSYGVRLTGSDETVLFKVFLPDGFDYNQTAVSYTQAATAAVGSGASVRAIEKLYKAYINNNIFPIDQTYDSDTTKHYNLYVIEHLRPVQNAWDRSMGGNPIVTIIAVDTSYVGTVLSAKLEPWLNAAVKVH